MSIADEPEDEFALPVVRRQVDLQPELLDRMWLDTSYFVLDDTLLAGGFLLNLDGHAEEPGHPLSAVVRAQTHLFGLRHAQEKVRAIEVFKPLTRGRASRGISLFIVLSTIVVVGLSVSRWSTLGLTMGFWGVVALLALFYSVWWFGERRRALRTARRRVDEERAGLGQALRDTLLRNFVARHRDTLVTCHAHERWATARLTDLERSLERSPSALRDAGEDSPQSERLQATCKRLADLRLRLKDGIAELLRSFDALVEEPPAAGQWLDSGLQLDVPAFRTELQGLGVEFSKLDSRFDRLLADEGAKAGLVKPPERGFRTPCRRPGRAARPRPGPGPGGRRCPTPAG